MKLVRLGLLVLCVSLLIASKPAEPSGKMTADYVEACSCHLFCPCYFNKHAEHPYCEFNMAVNVRKGNTANVDLAGAKYWLTGDLGELKVQEAPIEIAQSGDIAEAKLGGGQMAHMRLQREPGADGKGVVLKNVNYFGAHSNEGFALYKSIDHSADVAGHKFSYSDRNAFLITIDTGEAPPAMPAAK